jgi:ferric-dicitrate binding protein FerR (iron transport regulator)
MVKTESCAENSRLWTNDELFFDEELLQDIAKKLMRSYNVKVEVADSLRNKRFYGSFGISGNTIDKILDVMASTQQMNYKYENGVYILY